jgi:hypothetical protein
LKGVRLGVGAQKDGDFFGAFAEGESITSDVRPSAGASDKDGEVSLDRFEGVDLRGGECMGELFGGFAVVGANIEDYTGRGKTGYGT